MVFDRPANNVHGRWLFKHHDEMAAWGVGENEEAIGNEVAIYGIRENGHKIEGGEGRGVSSFSFILCELGSCNICKT